MNTHPILGYLVTLAVDPHFFCVDCYDSGSAEVFGRCIKVESVRSADTRRLCIGCGDVIGGPVYPDCGPRVFRVEWADLEGKPYHEDVATYSAAVALTAEHARTARILWVDLDGSVKSETWATVHGVGGYRKALVQG